MVESRGQDFLSRQIDATGTPPSLPFLKEPDAIAYTISFTYKGAPAATSEQGDKSDTTKVASPRIQTITVNKVGELRHDALQWSGGGASQNDIWYSQTAAFKPGTDARGRPNGIQSEPAFAKEAKAFPELAWVGKGTFVGGIQQGEKVINVYRYKFEGDEVGGFNPIFFQDEEVTAYIDESTRLPLAVKTPQYLLTYAYRGKPSSLTPPVEYAEAFQKYKEKKANIPRIP